MNNYRLPNGEKAVIDYINSDKELMFILTTKEPMDYYFLYKINKGNLEKIGKSKSPIELEEKFNVKQILLGGRSSE